MGAFDLPSIITAVVVVAILTAGVLAAIFGVIPFAQDNGAKQDLSAVRTAEGVARTKDNRFLGSGPIVAAGYLPSLPHTASVETDSSGHCYVALAKSGTGTIFYGTDAQTDPQVLERDKDTGCLSADALKALVDGVGGFSGIQAPAAPVVSSAVEMATRAKFTWPAVADAETYKVEYMVNTGSWASKTTAQKETTVNIDVNKGDTLYVRVAATNASGDSPYGTSVIALSGLENGSFESGMTGWTTSGNAPSSMSSTSATDGKQVAYLYSNAGGSTMSQTVSVPAQGTTLLSFSYQTSPSSSYPGTFQVQVQGTDGNSAKAVLSTSTVTAMRTMTVDLTPYLGQNVKLSFIQTGGGYASWPSQAYVDNVKVTTGAPDAPVSVAAWTNDSTATVQWTPPTLGSAGVTAYTITPYQGATALASVTVTGNPPAATAVITGLTNGTVYTFTVRSTNPLGSSPESAPSPAYTVNPNGVANGSFESGMTGWTTSGNAPSSMSSSSATDGKQVAYLYSNAGGSTMSQTVSVPAQGTTLLSFSYQTSPSSSYPGTFQVQVQGTDGNSAKAVLSTSTVTAMRTMTVDLTPYLGQNVKLSFIQTGGGYASWPSQAYVDNVKVTTK
ncbi:fibronectin type III domain-containing protein [Paeniglutamicibacter antarcticus]|uniref:Fibronectin type III domain-containing protein n=1 Tax=Arthrobacter terrae TaxID=2935737 RepID=A0A931CQ15_9MICC|nr:fibronectin type III domain-containing protein [Arthrobacter terrae]MBG0738894.1 fibronectin type III domain-containing protein [Arthrobacter terrae]